MNKADLVQRLGERAGMSGERARSVIEALFGTVSEPGLIGAALRAGERVQLPGFGTFETRQRKERVGRNPQTRERIVIPGGISPAFRPGSVLKAQLR